MVRLSLIALLSLALSGASFALPPAQQEALGTPVHASASWEYSSCGEPSDVVQIKSLKVSPDPPKPGEDLTVTVVGVANQQIKEGAYADVVVKLGLVKLLTKRFDVCEEARNADADVKCPVEKGEYEVVHTVALPKEIPPAKFNVHVQGYTAEDESMLCLDLKADFTKRFPHFGW